MIRKLHKKEIERLSGSSSCNAFFLNDLQDVLGHDDGDVLETDGLYIIRYPFTAVVERKDEKDPGKEDAEEMQRMGCNVFSAPSSVLSPILPFLDGYREEERKMMTITPFSFRRAERDERVRVLRTARDFLSLFRLYRATDGMNETFSEDEDGHNLDSFLSRSFPFTSVALFERGKAVSGAYIGNHQRRNATVSGVATHPDFRKRGFASSVVSELVDIAFSENMMPMLSLWYNNEEAGRIYRKLGFRDEGTFLHLRKEKT